MDSLSVETVLEDGQLWDDDRLWEENAQSLVEKEDAQPMFE